LALSAARWVDSFPKGSLHVIAAENLAKLRPDRSR
jgi:hypothetical protein